MSLVQRIFLRSLCRRARLLAVLLFSFAIADFQSKSSCDRPAGKKASERPRVKLAYERDGDIWGLTNQGKQILLIRHARSPAWSWDGKQLAYYRDRALWIVRLTDVQHPRKLCRVPRDAEIGPDADLTVPILTWHPKYPEIAFYVFEPFPT